MAVIDGLRELFSFLHPPKPPVPFSVLFKKFKSTLERNNRILELMADMGDKLGGDYVFDRQYIVAVCERVSDLVFKMISDLCMVTQSDNVELFIAFERIQHEIEEELTGRRAIPLTRLTVPFDDLNSDLSEETGNKLGSLGDLRNILGLGTPDGFAVSTKAFSDFMESNGLIEHIGKVFSGWDGESEAYFETMSRDIIQRILSAAVPGNIVMQINGMVDALASRHGAESMRFAVRSSAWGEDGEHSFAGQYESVLNVPRSGILDAYRRVVASTYAPEAWHYRLHRGYREHETAMGVGIQLMAGAQVSGAMYTFAPLPSEQEAMVVSAAFGLGPAVVQGIAESDTFILDRTPPHRLLSQEIGHKARMLVPNSEGGTAWEDVPDHLRAAACLSGEQLEKLAQAAMIIERYYKRPQDVEWAFDQQGSLQILQSRPLNIRPERPDAKPQIVDATRSGQVIFSDKGTVVQSGVASGKVYVALKDDDLKAFPYGAILVTQFTSPKYVRIMPKAQGIITDVGSPTGHMATLAREYRVPTVVDTGVATKMLATGDEITFDAGQNIVYRGIIRELSHFELTEQEVLEESYEYRLLRRLIKKINPLNLVDSHSDEFKPSRCRTFHDITRYVHEKAVEKLVDLSENYQKYHNKMPKRLDSKLPLGLMIIDIEGGVSAPPDAGSVTLTEVTCVPLRALLEGLSESGMWETEPVSIDIGSFMSSVTRTFNAPLSNSLKLGRNLAVVSKEYLNLNLRLGYHFNLLDAYIGDMINDNYLYFRFLGGVTDFVRRSRRAKFIAEVLEHLDFRVEVHGDLVVGRLKKISKERMVCAVKVLGGLIGYTRQLDVNMDSEEQISRHYGDFTRRIGSITEAAHVCSG